ncbi:MAG: metallophosphoesterase [Bacteroidetes bacterium]|nr:metallophosphoesterase [Bacteroidota bacterium]
MIIKKPILYTSLIVLIAFIIGLLNAHQLPIYKTTILLSPLLLYIDAYLYFIFTNKYEAGKLRKYITAIIIYVLSASLSIFLLALFYGFTNWSPIFNHLIFTAISISYIPKLFVFSILMILLLVDLLIFKRHIIRTRINRILGITFIVLFTMMLFGSLRTAYNIKINHKVIIVSKLPEPLNGLKIVHISDLHLGSWISVDPIKNLVEKINNLNPDLVFITGDIVNFHTDEIDRFAKILPEIRARYGVYSILGNHDYGEYLSWGNDIEKEANIRRLINTKESFGWCVLMNESYELEINGEEIIIAGVENWGKKSRFPKKGDIDKAIEGIDTTKTILLLSHDPSYWDEIISTQHRYVDVTFSGHTHGMQIGINNNTSLAKLFFKQSGGLYQLNSSHKCNFLFNQI